ncbi:MAG: tyrosine-type recombinase/integrase [Tardiphaga sp.]|nr:tyrosine-type recombinase/integrase [Tardiphaga sp.]
MPRMRLGKREISALQKVDKITLFYDTELTGFGAKVFPSGKLFWFAEYRPYPGGRAISKRRIKIGDLATHIPSEARNAASAILAQVRLGKDPARERIDARTAETVSDVLDAFLEQTKALRKASTVALYSLYIDKHLKPDLGEKRAAALRRDDVIRFHRKVGKEHPSTANRLIAVLGAAFAHSIKTEILPVGTANPAVKIEKFKEQGKERYLTEAEMLRLGDAIRDAEKGIEWTDQESLSKHTPKKAENRRTQIGPHAAAAIRLLIFTGARLREILHLEWGHVDLQRCQLFLPDSKTGKKTITLGAAAISVLDLLPHVGNFVIAGNDPAKPRSDLKRPWALVSKRANLTGVRLHDLRHSFASVGVGGGMGLPIIGKLLGHANASTTERYAHLAADPLRRAQDEISGKIAKAMGEKIA